MSLRSTRRQNTRYLDICWSLFPNAYWQIFNFQDLHVWQFKNLRGVTHKTVRRLIESKTPPATQVVPYAPWEIPVHEPASKTMLRVK